MKTVMPSFTAEALVAMAVGYATVPPPLLLMQIGFDPTSEEAVADYWSVIEAGSRSLAALHEAVEPGHELKEQLARSIRAMSEAPVFVTLVRTDRPGSHVLYCGNTTVVDMIDDVGNHRPQTGQDVENEIESYFAGYQVTEALAVSIPHDRFEVGAEASDSEDPVVADLVSDECTTFVVSVGRAAEGELHIMQWRATVDRLFAYQVDADQSIFDSVATSDAVAAVLELLERCTSRDD